MTRVLERLIGSLAPSGLLLVGHAESLTGSRHGLRYGRTAHLRPPHRGGMVVARSATRALVIDDSVVALRHRMTEPGRRAEPP